MNNYRDFLYGEGGSDAIDGMADGDIIFGGDGDDVLEGGGGPDRIDGGEGDDELDGGDGNDTLCDSTGVATCATAGAHLFFGGSGADIIWYESTTSCDSTHTPDLATSNGGDDMDECGDSDVWGLGAWPTCEFDIASKPTTCP